MSTPYYSETDRIRAALSFIPPDDHKTWVKMAYAVKNGLGDDGFDVWDKWSQGGANYQAGAAKATWRSAKEASRITVGSLFWLAEQNGFDPAQYRAAPISPAESARRRAEADERARVAHAAAERKREAAVRQSGALWRVAQTVAADHPYLARKEVTPVTTLREIDASALRKRLGYTPERDGEALTGRILVAPVKVGDKVSTLEFIDEAGRKSALAGGAKAGGYWATGALPGDRDSRDAILIGEGVATALSAHMAGGQTAIAALSCGNLPKVAQALRERYPHADLVMLADLGNGQEYAERAARESGARLAVPRFDANALIKGEAPTDFNDMASLYGLAAVDGALREARLLDVAPGQPQIRDHAGNTLYAHANVDAPLAVALEAAVKEGVPLNGAVLAGANLDDVNLRGAQMRHADLRDTSLRNADVQHADLRGTDFEGADLAGADARHANLEGANLNRTTLQGVQLDGANVVGVCFEGVDLAGASLDGKTVGNVKPEEPGMGKVKANEGAVAKAAGKRAADTKATDTAPAQAALADKPDKAAEVPAPSAPASGRRTAGAPLYDLKDVPNEVKAAAQHRFGSDLKMATPRESGGPYKGEVLNTDRYLIQEVGTRSVVFHDKSKVEFVNDRLKWCNENQRLNGADIQIGYDGDKGRVYPWDRAKDQLEKAVGSLKKSAKELGLGDDVIKTLDRLQDRSWGRVKEARSAAIEQAKGKAAPAQTSQPAKSADGPER